MKKSPTILDIAREAGVSKSTVSRILNNAENVSPRTRQRVLEVMLKYRYRPNIFARGLGGRRTGVVGVIVTDITNPFYSILVRGIEDVCRVYRYNIFLCNTDGREEEERIHIESLTERRVDGVILASTMLNEDSLAGLLERGVKVVLVARLLEDNSSFNYVVVDNAMGGYLAAKHLLTLGHKRIAYIAGPWFSSPNLDRFAGFQKALGEIGLGVDEKLIVQGDFTMESGYLAGMKLAKSSSPRPTAVFAANDAMAIGAMEAFSELGIDVPHEMSVIGFDDIPLGALRCIQLTTVSQSIYDQGAISGRTLIERILEPEKEGIQQIVLPPKLVVRKTCARVPGVESRNEGSGS